MGCRICSITNRPAPTDWILTVRLFLPLGLPPTQGSEASLTQNRVLASTRVEEEVQAFWEWSPAQSFTIQTKAIFREAALLCRHHVSWFNIEYMQRHLTILIAGETLPLYCECLWGFEPVWPSHSVHVMETWFSRVLKLCLSVCCMMASTCTAVWQEPRKGHRGVLYKRL